MLRRSGDALITCATETNGLIRDVQLCGKLDIKLQETLALVSRKGETTAVELHAESRHVDAVGPTAWNNRLTALAAKSLIVEILQGRTKKYRPVLGDGLMGLDLVRKAAPGFIRVLDRRAVELRMPNLFSRDLPVVARTASAEICAGAKVTPGEKVLLRIMKDKVIAQRGNLVIAECPNPPLEFVKHLQAGAGIAQGEVKSLQPISQTVEIGICD